MRFLVPAIAGRSRDQQKAEVQTSAFCFFKKIERWKKMMEIKDMRQLLGLSQQKFCDRYDIPLRTFQRWEKGDTPCPSYVKKLLERAVVQDAMTY